jgi:hypothetical protein
MRHNNTDKVQQVDAPEKGAHGALCIVLGAKELPIRSRRAM